MDPQTVIVALMGVLGLAVGSFLNVVTYRFPRGESLLFPASHCPTCTAPIRRRHNVPVLGWLTLRGRCASCSVAISARYPAVELGTGVLFAAITLRVGVSDYLPACLFLAAVGIVLAMIDVDGSAVPISVVAVAFVIGVTLLVPAAAGSGWTHVAASTGGAAVLALAYLIAATTSQRTIEPGILLLSIFMGFNLGWLSFGVVTVAALVSLGLVVTARCALTSTGRHLGVSSLPIATFVLMSAGLALLAPIPLATG